MAKGHSNKGRFFRFNTEKEMEKFIALYEDLFTPYSEDVLSYKKNYYDYDISDLKRGFEKNPYNNKWVLKVNLIRENLDTILASNSFKKEDFLRYRSIYAFEGD